MGHLKDKVALVTGGGSGIGFAITRTLLEEGMRVAICGKFGFAGTAAYSASKFGLMALSDSLRAEGISSNIKVTAICPGYVATPMVTDAPVPLDEMIQPEDIGKAVLFLLNLSEYAAVKEIVMTRKGED